MGGQGIPGGGSNIALVYHEICFLGNDGQIDFAIVSLKGRVMDD